MLHLSALARQPDVDATMHCHAKYCTMFALTRKPIPAVIEEVLVYLGGDVPVAEYKTTGSLELADEVSLASRRSRGGAHGEPRAVRRGPQSACTRSSSRSSWSSPPRSCGARSLLGEIVPLPDEIVEQFSGYYRMMRGRS